MPFNGAGVYTRIYNWVNDANAQIDITASRMDGDSDDFATAFNNCLTRDGQGFATANLPMGNFRHTGVGNAVARTDYTAAGQAQDGILNWQTAGGTADALTATYAPALASLVDGQLCGVRAASANATTTPTFAPNGLTAHAITKLGGSAVVAGEWAADQELILRYKLASTRWEILNPSKLSPSGSAGGDLTGTYPNPTIAANATTNSKLAQMAANTIKGNNTSSTANAADLTIPQVQAMFGVPTGAILDFGGTVVPTGYLACDGSAVSRTTQAALFAAIGTTWGAGDGSTTFNVPNFQRKVAVGSGGAGTGVLGNVVGNTGGAETHTLTYNELPSDLRGVNTAAGGFDMTTGSATIQNGGGVAFSIMQPSVVVLRIIKI